MTNYIINEYFNEINNLENSSKINNNFIQKIINNLDEIYKNNISEYLINYKDFHNIKNINDDFINNVSNIKIYSDNESYLILSCLYKNKKALIKLFYNPFINFDLLYEQMIYSKLKNIEFIPTVYNLGYIDLNIFLNNENLNEIIDYIEKIYDNEILNNYEMILIFKKSFNNLINNIYDLDQNFINYYNYSKNKKNMYICKLLIFFMNKINKHIHIIIMNDYINDDNNINFLDYYKKNIINSDINKNIIPILYNLIKNINTMNNEINLIHNNICLENIIIDQINNKCIITNFNMSYLKNIKNLSLYNLINIGIDNKLNNTIDLYIFLNNFINYTWSNLIPKEYNFFTYSIDNLNLLKKILFKKNKKLRNLLLKNHILFTNQINTFFCDNIIFNNINFNYNRFIYPDNFKNECIIPIIRKKFSYYYFEKYLDNFK